MIDLRRRFFLFGASAAAATLAVPAPKSFFIVKPPPLIRITRPERPFDLPMQQMTELLMRVMGPALDGQMLKMSAIPRWVVPDQKWYDAMVAREASS